MVWRVVFDGVKDGFGDGDDYNYDDDDGDEVRTQIRPSKNHPQSCGIFYFLTHSARFKAFPCENLFNVDDGDDDGDGFDLLGRICNPTALNISIFNAKTTLLRDINSYNS